MLALPELTPDTEARAADLFGRVLPVRVRVAGLAVLGGDKVTVARLLDVPEALTRAVLDLRAGVEGERHSGLAPPRHPRAAAAPGDLQRAVDVLGYDDVALTLTACAGGIPSVHEVRAL